MSKANNKGNSTILIPVFAPAVIVTFLLVVGTISNPTLAGEIFSSTLAWITQTFGWFYMLAVAIFLVFVVAIGFSRWGNIKLGPDHATPQYSFPAWFAMLFSAGYGIALLFFGVAEPVLHYASPPQGAAETVDAARQAMQIAFFHWGFHIWGIYGLVGLVLAYFAFRHGLPLSMRSALYPLIGERIHGPIGHTVDVIAILGTLFGIATTPTSTTSSSAPSTCRPTRAATGSATGRCSSSAGPSPGRRSWGCSSPRSRAGAPSASSCSACCWCRRYSPSCGSRSSATPRCT